MSALYRTEELRRIEQEHARVLAPGTLMSRAGHGAAHWLDRHAPVRPAAFVVLCGPGKNGGDGSACPGGQSTADPPKGGPFALTVAAIFELGLGRPPSAPYPEESGWANECGAPV